jgi:hypothetical protein
VASGFMPCVDKFGDFVTKYIKDFYFYIPCIRYFVLNARNGIERIRIVLCQFKAIGVCPASLISVGIRKYSITLRMTELNEASLAVVSSGKPK